MQVTRRDALKLAAAALVSFVLPAPRRELDLMKFCRRRPLGKYDCTLPYELEDFTFATDAKICVRVRPQSGDVIQAKGQVPPFDALSWNHERIRGWRPLPRLEPLLAKDSACPVCDGFGLEGDDIFQECERCDGCGNEWTGADYHLSYPITCRVCKGKGHVAPPGAAVCRACKGEAIGTFPSVVNLDGRYFEARLYELARQTGAEFVHDNWNAISRFPMLKFAFPSGVGLLMGIEVGAVDRRLVK